MLPLESGITGVVGPNGCGKSNIVDALRWVLGETKASSLRGELLEDVIFNGTENLRPLGLAEVTITLRAAGDDFFADLVDPRLELDAEASRLLQDLEEASDKVGQYSKIEGEENNETEAEASSVGAEPQQHPTDGVQSDRPKLKVIKGNLGAPQKKQDLTYLTRFSWLKSCNEVQVTRRLYRSGDSEFFINRVPCRLKDLKDLFRALGLGARAYTIVAQGEVSRIVSAKPEERRLIIEEAAGVSGFRDKIQTAKRRLEETGISISRLDDLLTEISRQVNILKRQAQRARDRQALKDSIAALDKELFSESLSELSEKRGTLGGVYARAEEEERSADAQLASVQAMEHEARSALMSVDVETDHVRSKIDSLREELNHRAQQRTSGESKINELKAYAVAAGAEQERLSALILNLESRKAECQKEINALSERESILAAGLKDHESFINNNNLPQIGAELDESRRELKEAEKKIRTLRDEIAQHRGSLAQIKEQILSSSPVAQLKSTRQSLGEDLLVVADVIGTESRYSRALQAILSEKSEFIISDNPHEVARVFLKEKEELDSDNKKGLGLGVFKMQGRYTGHAEAGIEVEGASGSVRKLLSLVNVRAEYQPLAETLLQDVFFAESVDDALQFFGSAPNDGRTIVTLDGDILTKDSFYSFRNEAGIINLKARVQELEKVSTEIERLLGSATEDYEGIQQRITAKEAQQSELLDEIQARQKALREVSNQHAGALGRLQSEKRVLAQIDDDIKNASGQKQQLFNRLNGYKEEEQGILRQLEALVKDDEQQVRAELEELKTEHQRLDLLRKDGHAKLSDAAGRLDECRQRLDLARSQVSHLSLDLQKITLEEENIRGRISEQYGEGFLNVLATQLSDHPRLTPERKAECEQEASRLKARIIREGDVDFTSIERYEEENERLETLEQQRSDLKEAAETLERTIDLLTETSKIRFIATFEAIRKNFANLVPRVFGGGKADLELLDAANPLDSGVEIIVRPPGKKLRSIDLLSGGEKALTATALIFAMFLVRPSPLCVLDEVDAPLDDANLVRLLSLIKEMSKRTQFIVITHNKQSMVASDNLIGVTMQEPGASKVISVSLQEAFSQVA